MKKNSKLLKLTILLIVILFIISILIFSSRNLIRKNIEKARLAENYQDFSWEKKCCMVNYENNIFEFHGVVIIQELSGIETIKYEKDGQEVTLNGNGKTKIEIDYIAEKDIDYEFKIKPYGQSEKIKILNVNDPVDLLNPILIDVENNIYTKWYYNNGNREIELKDCQSITFGGISHGEYIYTKEKIDFSQYKTLIIELDNVVVDGVRRFPNGKCKLSKCIYRRRH